jgi:tetratricopeptide (TPR) repeat protein
VGDDSTTAWVRSAAGLLAAYEGRAEVSVEHFERALELARRNGDRRLESLTLCHLGATPTSADRPMVMLLESVEQGLELGRELGSRELITHGLTTLGELSRANGEPERAERAYREALDLSAEVANASYLAINTLNLGHALAAQGRAQEALEAYRRGIELAEDLGSRILMAWNLSGIAGTLQALGRHEQAARLAGAAQSALDVLGANHGPVDQPLHEASQAAVQAALGDERYEACFAQGQGLALDGGVALAAQALDEAG